MKAIDWELQLGYFYVIAQEVTGTNALFSDSIKIHHIGASKEGLSVQAETFSLLFDVS
jgi:hypothetical protein